MIEILGLALNGLIQKSGLRFERSSFKLFSVFISHESSRIDRISMGLMMGEEFIIFVFLEPL